MVSLLGCDGQRFAAEIKDVLCEGIISVEGNQAFLCQNVRDGLRCSDRKGFKYSWCYQFENGTFSESVKEFKLLDEVWEGDWIYVSNSDPECKSKEKRIFITKVGPLAICVTEGYEPQYLREKDLSHCFAWKYFRPIPIVEITMDEALRIVAEQKQVPVEQVRIRK